jgi:pimeloyl-ACP methyl ester carboxylesterase
VSPCAARPILFVHGHQGSNDDYFSMLDELAAHDPRYKGYVLAGVDDHAGWTPLSIERKRWLFAFDYYIRQSGDGRGSYTAGAGRIGSMSSKVCTSPSGHGNLVATDGAYDIGTLHDYAADLKSFVDSVLLATGASEVDLVGHSMGGMVGRSYLSFYGGDARVSRVLLLASPIKGLSLAVFLSYFPLGQPSWMGDHEVAEVDGGSALSKIRFHRCGETPLAPGAWGDKLLDHELLFLPQVEMHVMTGQLDPVISYSVGHHPLALSHEVVPGADHSGILSKQKTIDQVRKLLGGTYP